LFAKFFKRDDFAAELIQLKCGGVFVHHSARAFSSVTGCVEVARFRLLFLAVKGSWLRLARREINAIPLSLLTQRYLSDHHAHFGDLLLNSVGHYERSARFGVDRGRLVIPWRKRNLRTFF
jgi:hypothetical protein